MVIHNTIRQLCFGRTPLHFHYLSLRPHLSDHKISRWVHEDRNIDGQHGFEDEFVILVTTRNFFKAENLSRGRNQLAIIMDVPEKCGTFSL